LTLSDLDTLAADLAGANPTAVDLPAETDWLGHHVRAVAALAGLPVDQLDGDS
jgi:hypothetical protein